MWLVGMTHKGRARLTDSRADTILTALSPAGVALSAVPGGVEASVIVYGPHPGDAVTKAVDLLDRALAAAGMHVFSPVQVRAERDAA